MSLGSLCDSYYFQSFLSSLFLLIRLVSIKLCLPSGWLQNVLHWYTVYGAERHPTDEQLRLTDTSSNKNMPPVPFELFTTVINRIRAFTEIHLQKGRKLLNINKRQATKTE